MLLFIVMIFYRGQIKHSHILANIDNPEPSTIACIVSRTIFLNKFGNNQLSITEPSPDWHVLHYHLQE